MTNRKGRIQIWHHAVAYVRTAIQTTLRVLLLVWLSTSWLSDGLVNYSKSVGRKVNEPAMKTIEFEPLEGAGPFRFHTSWAENKKLVPKEAGKLITREDGAVMYPSFGLSFDFRADDSLSFVQIFRPLACKYRKVNLLGRLSSVLDKLARMGFEAEFKDGSYDYSELGIVLWCPDKRIETASLYIPGYYGR